ncbi:MAG: RHS repeat-associated core domain-containing protein [Anaerolineales bacterium]|jgi:RHS repeat-associated protein|nr:RHS repeat-associated core domain-containing protein [Anaerolineales bacterium]
MIGRNIRNILQIQDAALGSTSITVDSTGTKTSELRYKPWGEVRYSSSANPGLPTQYTFTGQRSYMDDPTTTAATEGFGLMFYNARWYDPYITQFSQPDTIIPNPGNSLDWNRYSYARYNPLKYTDPSGHNVCDEDGNCYDNNNTWHRAPGASRLSTIDTWKMMIRSKFGVKMKDDKIAWGAANLQTAYGALNAINNKLNGYLRNLVGGATFTLTDGGNKYYGAAHHDGSGVTFHVADSTVEIPMINFLHETAHLLDSRPATRNVFSGSLPDKPSWVVNGFVYEEILLGKIAQPVQSKYIVDKNGKQTESYSPNEYWADAFANYVGDNIDLEQSAGAALAADVANALNPYINP